MTGRPRAGRSGAGRNGGIPTDARIRALHEKYAPTRAAFDLVYTHCQIVCALAEHIAARQPDGLDVDIELVRAGALLHDLGVYQLYDSTGVLDYQNYIRHGVLGRDVLRDLGFPDLLCRFCSCHTGVGLSRADVQAQGLPIPPADYLAESTEEELVMYADKFHSKSTPPRFVTSAAYEASVRRFGPDKAERFTLMVKRWGEPDLGPFARAHGMPIRGPRPEAG